MIYISTWSILVINFDAKCHYCLLRVSLQRKSSLLGWSNETLLCAYITFQAISGFYISKTHLSIYDRNISSWWGFSCGGWRKYVKTSISWGPHNLILPVQAMMAKFGDPGIKPVLGFHLKQWTRGEGNGETNTLITSDTGKWSPRIMAAKLLKTTLPSDDRCAPLCPGLSSELSF